MDYYSTITAQETKQGNKQNNLLILIVSYEKSCLIRRKTIFGLGLLHIWRIQAQHDKMFETTTMKKENKNKKTIGHTTPAMGCYSRNGEMGDIYSRSDM